MQPLLSIRDSMFFSHERKTYALISKHGNGLALVRQITDEEGKYIECRSEHMDMETMVTWLRIYT